MPVNCLKFFAASAAAGFMCFTALSQQDFNHYKTLVSRGPISVDFTVATAKTGQFAGVYSQIFKRLKATPQ